MSILFAPQSKTVTTILLRSINITFRTFASPPRKLPNRRITISCGQCKEKLYKYAKGNGASSQLVKIYLERIVVDYTNSELEDEENVGMIGNDDNLSCPNCDVVFGRMAMIHGRKAIKVIGGKVVYK